LKMSSISKKFAESLVAGFPECSFLVQKKLKSGSLLQNLAFF